MTKMKAVVTVGSGDYDKLEYQDVQVPLLENNEVLVQVLAAGVNNTDINTRVGWYDEGGWDGNNQFPLIQGTDCCGKVVKVCSQEHEPMLGKRVLLRSCMRPTGGSSFDQVWMGSNFSGAFAQFVKIEARAVYPIESSWTDMELGTIPCSYATAENMVHRAKLKANETVLIPGASGGVGSALVQLCKRRKVKVIAISSKEKEQALKKIGADQVLTRETDFLKILREESVDAVIDNVGGKNFPLMLKLLKRGGRYASSGAIADPIVSLDMRDFYLKDLNLIGCTAWDEQVFSNLISYIEKNEISPLLAATFDLKDIVEAQKLFIQKTHVGKIVLTPPPLTPQQEEYLK